MQVTLPIKTPFRTSTDREIIEGIKNADSEKDLKLFQYEFYNRFAPYIYKVALLCCRNFNDADFLSREILQLTFINAYRNISRFDFPVESEDSDCTNLTKAWLGKIANNEFRRALSKKVNDTVDFDSLNLSETSSDDLFTNLYEEPEQEITNAFKLKLQEAMNQLSEKDQDIIRTYAREGCIDSTRHLSEDAMKYLCETYNSTSEAIRQRKKRALDKIKAICSLFSN